MRLNEFASGDKVVTEGIVDDMPADNMINTMNSLRKDSDRNRYAHLQNLLKRAKKPETIEKIKALLAKEFPQGVTEDTLGEVSSNWEERIKAQERIADLVQSRENWEDHPIDDINEMKKLVKIVGRATVIRDSDNYHKLGTAGKLLDLMTHYYNQKQIQSGTLPQFDSAVASSQYFARQIAMHTNGTYNHRYARVWTTSYGQRYKDPSDYVEYNSKDDLDSAWQWIESKGKKVYYYDHFKHLNEAVKIGKFIVEPASYTARAFSDSPETVHAVSVRTAAVINKSVRRQVDISDQQANALKDIAATKNKNALEGIKLIMSILQGEQDVKSVIDNSKKLDSNVKAKLDAIIAGAANFKEPDQGVTEGEIVKGTFGQKFKPNLGRTVQTSPYEHRPDIDIPQYDPVRKTNWIKGISKENNKEPYDHFELDQTKPNIAHIIGVTKDGLQVKISTSNLKLAEILVDLYNRGGFTDADIEKIPMKSPEREKPKLKLVKSDDIEEDTTSPSEKVEAYGYVYNNRDQRIVWRKIFSSEDEANRWADRRNATVLGIKPLKPSDKISETSAGSVATVVNPKMKDRSKVGTLFGGTYKQRKDK
jgi:hypothetical protein